MSSRHLRRKQNEELKPAADIESESNDVIENHKPKTNMFDLLALDDGEEESPPEKEEIHQHQKEEEVIPKTTKKKKKKKKKKLKDNEQKQVEEDIDATINEVNAIYGDLPAVTASCSGDPVRQKSIYNIDYRNLNSENEMKKKFGASVVNREKRNNAHGHKYRKTMLITPRDNWPRLGNIGLKMKIVKQDSNIFAFEHDENYQLLQFLFLDAVNSLDHNNIMALMNAHPYHIDSLLQLSEVCLINEDYQMAVELVERALHVFERSFHPSFNLAQGTCRLEYKRAENRPFFLALFRHIGFLSNKACYRTALEVAKVLLGLSPTEDPLCVLLLIDYYAIKSEEYDFFVQLYQDFEVTKNISSLPNFLFSYALCKFHQGKLQEANDMLTEAILRFPSILSTLEVVCSVNFDPTLSSHPLFSNQQQTASLNQLIALYVGRCQSLWKSPEVLDWFTTTCKHVVDNYHTFTERVTDAQRRRKNLYLQSPNNVIRHILISGIKEAIRELPSVHRNQTVMTHDPLPPPDSVRGYERPTPTGATAGGEENSLLSMFFESLLPSYQDPAPVRQHDQAQYDDGTREETALTQGAQRLMDAMRELMSTMTHRTDLEPPDQEGENNENQQWEQ